MLERLQAERQGVSATQPYGIDWFDQWEVGQRLWLLDTVAAALLTDAAPPPEPAAIWEATVDAIFCEVLWRIMDESTREPAQHAWREQLVAAYRCQHRRWPPIDPQETDPAVWRRLATQVADAILGVTTYQKAEAFRDGEFERSRRFLMHKGLPEDYLQRIPPLRSDTDTATAIAHLKSILGQ
jgi:hypothetical protein